jgi:hypothetical protein
VIVTIEEPRPSIRCCGPDGSCARRTAALEFVDDVEVITRGDGIGGVQQIGLAAVRGRPNACELAMPLTDRSENAGPRPCQTTEKAPAADSIRIDVFDDSLDQCCLRQFRRQRATLIPTRWLL